MKISESVITITVLVKSSPMLVFVNAMSLAMVIRSSTLRPTFVSRATPVSASLLNDLTVAISSNSATCIDVYNCFGVEAGAFDTPSLGAGAGGNSVVIDFIIFGIFMALFVRVAGGDEDKGLQRPSHPSSISKPGAAKERKNKIEFGWLHADLRVPLPSYEDLKTSCHLIGEGVGDHEGFMMYLCASDSPNDPVIHCERSNDFSKHYEQDVYLCRGGAKAARASVKAH